MTSAAQGEGVGRQVFRYALATLLPPLAVGLLDGLGLRLLVSIVMTMTLPLSCSADVCHCVLSAHLGVSPL